MLPYRLPFELEVEGLRPIVLDRLFEPRVFEGILGCDTLFGVVDEYLAQEVEELFVEGGGGRNNIL